jgi:tetraacyldisaccharide 4'-kinase|tara:strand:+ start:467 stop:1408 length:942 start_codon:yes stop_codon:yes gene_type:complete
MKIKKPKFWDYNKPNIISYILWPLSLFLQFLSNLKLLIVSKKKFEEIKTICVGNIYVGGTGKTSLSLMIYDILLKNKIKTCFIKKYYSDQKDEQKILENKGKLFNFSKRELSLEKAIKENYDVAIFDDGLQDKSIEYDLSFVCFNNLNFIGNGLTMPSGPLRESFKNIKKYKYIFLNGNMENIKNIREKILETNSNAKIFEAKYVPMNIKEFDLNEKYLVFSGIGNHKTFLSMLKNNKMIINKDIEFPDHYNYSEKDLKNILRISKDNNLKILTTEKDFFRLNIKLNEIKFIKSKLEISNEKDLINILSKLYE